MENIQYMLSNNISVLNKILPQANEIPQIRFPIINEFINNRKIEMQKLFQYRLKSYLKDYIDIKTGLIGEQSLQKTLEMHSSTLINLNNIRLEFDDGKESVEIDNIVITQGGIFACEVKNYGIDGTFRIVIEADGSWYREYPSKNKDNVPTRVLMKNPYSQNDRHVAFLERFANSILNRNIENSITVHNIIVLANDEVQLSCSPSAKQILARVGTVYNQIKQYNEKIFTLEEMEILKNAFIQNNCPPKPYQIIDYTKELTGLIKSYQNLYDYSIKTYNSIESCYNKNRWSNLPQY